MKIYQLIIFLIFFIYIQNACVTTSEIKKYTDCTTRVISSAEKLAGDRYCCYLYGVSGSETTKTCIPISQGDYEDIESTIKFWEKFYSINMKSFDCKSSYIQIGLLGLLFLLF